MISGCSPYIGPWNQHVRSFCSCGLLGPYSKIANLMVPYFQYSYSVTHFEYTSK